MTEYEELTTLLKMMAERIQQLENTVYNQDNILMKSGLVKVEGERPHRSLAPDSNVISKMDWSQLDELVKGLSGEKMAKYEVDNALEELDGSNYNFTYKT